MNYGRLTTLAFRSLPKALDLRFVSALSGLSAGLVLRFCGLGRAEISSDESFSWKMIQMPVLEMVRRLADDVHPPLYYLLLKCWCFFFGDSLVSMRSLSAAFGGAAMLGIWLCSEAMTKQSFGTKSSFIRWPPGSLALWLYALSPAHVLQDRTARMYALGTALAVISTWFLVRALWEPAYRLVNWVGYALAATGFVYTHYYANFTVAAQFSFVFGLSVFSQQRRWAPLLPAFSALLGILVGYLPWLPEMLRQLQSVRQGYWIPELTMQSVGELLVWFVTEVPYSYSTLASIMVSSWLIMLLSILPSWTGKTGWLLSLLMAIPWVGGVGLSVLGKTTIVLDRYLLFSHVSYLIAVCFVLCLVPVMLFRFILLALFLVNSCAVLVQDAQALVTQSNGLQQAVDQLANELAPDQLLVFSNPRVANQVHFCLSQKAKRPSIRVVGEPYKGGRHQVHVASILKNEWITQIELSRLRDCTIWFVGHSQSGFRSSPSWTVEYTQSFRGKENQYWYVVKLRR